MDIPLREAICVDDVILPSRALLQARFHKWDGLERLCGTLLELS